MRIRSVHHRRRLKGTQRRTQILESAVGCFARAGFRGTTTRDLARCCGVNEAILFRHFPTKEHLYRAILDERLNRPVEDLYPAYPAVGGDALFFSEIARGVVKRMEEDPLFLRVLLYSALEDHRLARDFTERRVRRSVDYLVRFIRKRQRQKIYRPMHPEIAARAFLGMAVHHALMTRLFLVPPRGVAREQAIAIWVSLFLSGISKGRAG